MALFFGRAGDKSAEHVASFDEQREPQAKPAVLQYFGKTAVNNKFKESTVMMSLAWTYLVAAGIFEIGWPVGLKMAQSPGKTVIGVLLAGACMIVSGFLLFLAQRHIPMGTAYAVWTGIGAAGTFILGIFLYGDPVGLMRIFAVLLIISGVVLLKLAH